MLKNYIFDPEISRVSRLPKSASISIAIVALIGLYWMSRVNYLLFHSIVEGYCTVIGFAIFVQSWNARKYMKSGYLLYLGIAYLFIGLLDFLHFLAYSGMGVFPGRGPNLPTQLWVASRYLESLSFLTAFFYVKRRLSGHAALAAFALFTAFLLASIFYWRIFPVCYVDGVGLTGFKVASEYVICAILLVSLLMIHRSGGALAPHVRTLVLWSVILTILSELAFTLYMSIFGLINMTGHLLKIVSFYLIYKAIIYTSFHRPFDLIFREMKQKDLALQRDLATIKSLEKDRGIILSMLVHDMKTPLVSIKGFANLLLGKLGELDENKSKEYLNVIFRQSGQLEKLIHDILVSSKSGHSKLQLNWEDCDLVELAKEVAASFQHRCTANGLKIKVEMNQPALKVRLDRVRMQRALSNLIDNAIRFSPENGTIFLRVFNTSQAYAIEVEDQGCGISENDAEDIFKPFYRGTGPKDSHGYGLGLAGVKTIVESHGGVIGTENAGSGGALFKIIIPADLSGTEPGLEAQPKSAPAVNPKQKRADKRILLVEDDEASRMMILAILEGLGYGADGVSGGEEALESLVVIPYDLVLMDIHLGGMDGLAATRAIREMNGGPASQRQVPILALTAHSGAAERDKALEAGADDYLNKPIRPEALAQTLDRWLSIKGWEQAPAPESPSRQGEPSGQEVFLPEEAVHRMADDRELFKTIFKSYADDIPLQLAKLKNAIEQKHRQEAQDLAHTIKGSAANLSAPRSRSAAQRVEDALMRGDWAEAEELANSLEHELARLIAVVKELGLA